MALNKDFPKSPYDILDPYIRWFSADEALREQGYEKRLLPLVATLRKKVKNQSFEPCSGMEHNQ